MSIEELINKLDEAGCWHARYLIDKRLEEFTSAKKTLLYTVEDLHVVHKYFTQYQDAVAHLVKMANEVNDGQLPDKLLRIGIRYVPEDEVEEYLSL